MECTFLYTRAEMMEAVSAQRQFNRRATALTCVVLGVIASAFAIGGTMHSPNPLSETDLMINAVPLLVFWLILALFLVSPIRKWNPLGNLILSYSFTRNPLYNQTVLYQFEETGFTLQSAVYSQNVTWAAIGKAGETSNGFVLFWGESTRMLHWIPKHGFSSPQDIAACRELLRRQLPHFKSKY